MGSTSDSDEALDILVAGFVDGSHCPHKANLVGRQGMFISDCWWCLQKAKDEGHTGETKKEEVWAPKKMGKKRWGKKDGKG